MEMPKPSDAHRKLEVMVGNWTGDEKVHPSPFDPDGGPAQGKVTNRSALDGFVVVQDYQQERGGHVTLKGHAVVRYDGEAKQYVMHWFDSMGMPPSVFRGDMKNRVLQLACQDAMGHSRATLDFSKAGTYTFKMEVSPDGEQWIPFMEGKYKRQSAH